MKQKKATPLYTEIIYILKKWGEIKSMKNKEGLCIIISSIGVLVLALCLNDLIGEAT